MILILWEMYWEEKKADFVVVGRQFIADPNWPEKHVRVNQKKSPNVSVVKPVSALDLSLTSHFLPCSPL